MLSDSSARAKRWTRESDAEAVALLLEQQKIAEGLLLQDLDGSADSTPVAEDTDASLEAHRIAAEVLSAAEAEVAAGVDEDAKDESVNILMAGHREAAAILLEAWMRVTEGRSGGEGHRP